MNNPVITVIEDMDAGFVLMATSYSSTEPAGPRLFRAEPWPSIKFVHDSREQAENDAATLREYIATKWPKKAMSKAALKKSARKQGAD